MATAKKTASRSTESRKPVDADPDMPEGAEEIDDGDVDEVVSLAEGDSISGKYCGFKLTRSGKPDKKSTLHKIVTDGGGTVGIYGSHQLDMKLEKAGVGARVWIKYIGKKEIGNGNTLHEFRVAKLESEDKLPF